MKILRVNGWSPFNGFNFKGTIEFTIINGKIKMKEGKILGEPEGTPWSFCKTVLLNHMDKDPLVSIIITTLINQNFL